MAGQEADARPASTGTFDAVDLHHMPGSFLPASWLEPPDTDAKGQTREILLSDFHEHLLILLVVGRWVNDPRPDKIRSQERIGHFKLVIATGVQGRVRGAIQHKRTFLSGNKARLLQQWLKHVHDANRQPIHRKGAFLLIEGACEEPAQALERGTIGDTHPTLVQQEYSARSQHAQAFSKDFIIFANLR